MKSSASSYLCVPYVSPPCTVCWQLVGHNSWYYPAAKSSEDIPTVPKDKFRSIVWVSRHTVHQKTILLLGPSKFAQTYKKHACLSSWVTLFTNNIQARILFASLAFVQNALKWFYRVSSGRLARQCGAPNEIGEGEHVAWLGLGSPTGKCWVRPFSWFPRRFKFYSSWHK